MMVKVKEKKKGEEEEKEIVVVMVMSCVVVVEGQCGCSVLTFNCTRKVGAAIPATLSDAVFTLTHQLKSSNLGKETGRELKIIIQIQKNY